MELYLFDSDRTPRTIGFTALADGSNLPSELGPWRLLKKVDLSLDGPSIDADPERVLLDLDRKGYSIQPG